MACVTSCSRFGTAYSQQSDKAIHGSFFHTHAQKALDTSCRNCYNPVTNAVGNIAAMNGLTYTYSLEHVHAVSGVDCARCATQYAYDANGNMITRTWQGALQALSYDAENRLVGVDGLTDATLSYDGQGQRVVREMGGETRLYLEDWFEADVDDDPTLVYMRYYYFGGQRVAMRTPDGVTFLHADHLGSTMETTNEEVTSQLYFPYGSQRTVEEVASDYRYTGQRWEEAIGLYDYKARWYDPALGRFIQPDSIVPEPGNPQALNRYAYVVGNPVVRTDPTGRWGPKVHFALTAFWAFKTGTQVRILVGPFAGINLSAARSEALTIALNDIAVDIRPWGPAVRDVLFRGGPAALYKTARTPSPELGGAIPEQYNHYPSMADAVARLTAAIEAKDLVAFGEALHSYQDYFSHTRNGLTAPPGDMASITQNCPECLQENPLESLLARVGAKGTATYAWDEHSPAHPYAAPMDAGSQWYILLFYLNYFGISYEDYVAAYGVPYYAPQSEEQ